MYDLTNDKLYEVAYKNFNTFYRQYEVKPDDWYDTAYKFALEVARLYHRKVKTIAAMIAVMSPMTEWGQNCINVLHVCQYGEGTMFWKLAGFNRNIEKAIRCFAENTDKYVSGKKVTEFYHNIMGKRSNATIDIWMFKIAMFDQNLTSNTTEHSWLQSRIDIVKLAFENFCIDNGHSDIASLQAGMWIMAKSQWGVNFKPTIKGLNFG